MLCYQGTPLQSCSIFSNTGWGTKGLLKGLGASGLRGPEPKCQSIYLSIYLSNTVDFLCVKYFDIHTRHTGGHE